VDALNRELEGEARHSNNVFSADGSQAGLSHSDLEFLIRSEEAAPGHPKANF
jgi:hypothetical protein